MVAPEFALKFLDCVPPINKNDAFMDDLVFGLLLLSFERNRLHTLYLLLEGLPFDKLRKIFLLMQLVYRIVFLNIRRGALLYLIILVAFGHASG